PPHNRTRDHVNSERADNPPSRPRAVRTPAQLPRAPPSGGLLGAATPTRTPSWATHATAQRLPGRSRTLPTDHLVRASYVSYFPPTQRALCFQNSNWT